MVAPTVPNGTSLTPLPMRLPAADGHAGVDGHERLWFGRTHEMLGMPHLIEIQLKSFDWFVREGLKELFSEISPIGDFTGKNLELELAIGDEPFGPPKYSQEE